MTKICNAFIRGAAFPFALQGTILNGIGIWDLVTVGDAPPHALTPGRTVINISQSQGCGQFISSDVNIYNGRWNRCSSLASLSVPEPIPEPSTLILLGSGLLFMTRFVRRFSAQH
jgi:hypothetical protein